MNARGFIRGLTLLAAASLVAACAPTVNGVCDDLDDECSDYIPIDDCQDEGHRIEDLAESLGCEAAFDDYLECIDTQLCDWRDECIEIRIQLDECLGDISSL